MIRLTFATAAILTTTAQAQIKPELFDRDGNGLLDVNERKSALRHQASAFYRAADTDYNGFITDTEKDVYIKGQLSAAETLVLSTPEVSLPVSVTIEDFSNSGMVNVSEQGEEWPMYGIQIRRGLADIDRTRFKSRGNRDQYFEALRKTKSAEIGFSNNAVSGDESWSARGVIARPFRFDLEDGSGGAILPSLQFDRVTNSNAANTEIDSLILGLEVSHLSNSFGIVETSRTSLGAEYGTTFDLDDGISGVRLQWEPTFSPGWLGNVSTRPVGNLPLFYTTRQYLHAEGGHAEATAKRRKSEYLRLGVGAGMSFYFAPGLLERVSLNADYRYYEDMTGGNDEFESFKATAEYRLDEDGHFNLQAAYENGMISLSHQKVDLFTLGFGVKF